MRDLRPQFHPGLEPLEDRTVPATLRLIGGNLFISNPLNVGGASNVKLAAIANNQFEIYDNGNLLATVSVGGTIYYTGSNVADTLTVEMGGNSFTGNLFARMGNSADTVDITGDGGSILGNTQVFTGRGADTTNLNSTGAGAMTFGGNVMVFDQLGADTVNLGNAGSATSFLGNVQLNGANTIAAGLGAADFVGGSLTVQSFAEGNPLMLTFGDNFAVSGNTTVRGTAVADSVMMGANIFGGNAQFQLGNGNDTFNIIGAAAFDGNLDVDLGDGSNEADLSTAFEVGGSFTLRNSGAELASALLNPIVNGNFNAYLGNGDYSLSFSDTAFVAGNQTIRTGNGTSTIGIQNVIGGNLSITHGNGEGNSTQVFGTAVIGGRLIYRGGNGGTALSPNSLVLGATGLYDLDVVFGNGDDCFTFAGFGIQLTGRVNGGTGTDGLGDTSGVELLPTLTIESFEIAC